jgi:hypothetical protein
MDRNPRPVDDNPQAEPIRTTEVRDFWHEGLLTLDSV